MEGMKTQLNLPSDSWVAIFKESRLSFLTLSLEAISIDEA